MMKQQSKPKERQQKVGIPAKRRGQQTGFAGAPDQNREVESETPSLRGRFKQSNQMFADKSSQGIGTSPASPKSNSPSTTGVIAGKQSKKISQA
jgi:hypothetical protein